MIEVFHIISISDDFPCIHIYRENNIGEDSLSKEGLELVHGKIRISEVDNDSYHHYYHRTFKEDQGNSPFIRGD